MFKDTTQELAQRNGDDNILFPGMELDLAILEKFVPQK